MKLSIKQRARNMGLTEEALQAGVQLALARTAEFERSDDDPSAETAVIIKNGRMYRRHTYNAIAYAARRTAYFMSRPSTNSLDVPKSFWGDFEPHEDQRAAIERLRTARIAILTGGPGVGKTTLLRKAVELYNANRISVTLMAPTGKAAVRLGQQVGQDASTVHRVLGFPAVICAGPLIRTNVAVVDEASMLDIHLFAALLSALSKHGRLLLVGDVDQLPSVGPGRVLADLIDAGVPTIKLTKIFRQAEESAIPHNAQAINRGEMPQSIADRSPTPDFHFIEQENPEFVRAWLCDFVAHHIPTGLGVPISDVQVLSPQHGGVLGVTSLNLALQQRINPTNNYEHDVHLDDTYTCRVRDRVIHTRNNYDLQLMNGSLGYVVDAYPGGVDMSRHPRARTSNPQDRAIPLPDIERGHWETLPFEARDIVEKYPVVVFYPDLQRFVAYDYSEVKELKLAYAITIHKAQGSQFPAVVMPVHTDQRFMLSRQLLYTGVTRAERQVVLLGEVGAVRSAIMNSTKTYRKTVLQTELHRALTLRDAFTCEDEAPDNLGLSNTDPQDQLSWLEDI